MIDTATEHRAANILSGRGVALQIAAPLLLRIFGRKKLKMEVRAATVRNLLKIAAIFGEMGIKNTGEMDMREAYSLYAAHGKRMSHIVALCISGTWPFRLRALVLRYALTEKEMSYLFHLIMAYGGIEDFINTIRLAEATRITKPMNLSPEQKMS